MAVITAGTVILYNTPKLRLRLEDWDDTPVKLALLEATEGNTLTLTCPDAGWFDVT